MALGEILRETREAKGLTASEVAQGTRMKVQIVEDLEREDFGRIAAVIYGKGFIKLYAEFIGLDPAPLLDEYVAISSGKPRSIVNTEPPARKVIRRAARTSVPAEAPNGVPETSEKAPPADGKAVASSQPSGEDLFSLAARKIAAPAQPAPSDEPAPSVVIEDESVAEPPEPKAKGPSISEKVAEAWSRSRDWGRTQWHRLVDWGKAGYQKVADTLGSTKIGDMPLKIIGGSIAALVLLLVIVVSINNCGRKTAHPEDEELTLAVPMPETYFDE